VEAHSTGLARATATVCFPYKLQETNGKAVKTYSFTNRILLQDVTAAMYSSTDLLNWENLGLQSTVGQMWRPKLAKPNGSFWVSKLLLHYHYPPISGNV